MDDETEIEDKVKKKTLSVFLKDKSNKGYYEILKFLSFVSKNIYNTTIYIHKIYFINNFCLTQMGNSFLNAHLFCSENTL